MKLVTKVLREIFILLVGKACLNSDFVVNISEYYLSKYCLVLIVIWICIKWYNHKGQNRVSLLVQVERTKIFLCVLVGVLLKTFDDIWFLINNDLLNVLP